MELHAVLTSIADSLRQERARAGLTLQQLAERADLSPAHLSRLESGDRQPSVAALITLSRALGIPVSSLLGEGQAGSTLGIYADDEPIHVANGLSVSAHSGFPGSSTLEALRITIDPSRIPPPFAHHRGEEWIYVISGLLRLEYGGETHLLEPGSSVHFDADSPHRLGAQGMSTDVLVVTADSLKDRRGPVLPSSTLVH
jgi:transcriptional regulator with XRE-family HTH domain